MQPPKLNCDQHVCVLRPQWIGTIWLQALPLTWVPDSLVCKEAQHRPVKPLHTWPHGCNLARSVRGQITNSGWSYPKGYTQVYVGPHLHVQRCASCWKTVAFCLFFFFDLLHLKLFAISYVLMQSLTLYKRWCFKNITLKGLITNKQKLNDLNSLVIIMLSEVSLYFTFIDLLWRYGKEGELRHTTMIPTWKLNRDNISLTPVETRMCLILTFLLKPN